MAASTEPAVLVLQHHEKESLGHLVFGYWAALAGLPGPPLAPKVIC